MDKRMRMAVAIALGGIVVVLLFLWSKEGGFCPKPDEVLASPDEYYGKEICAAGRVADRYDWPMTNDDYYKVVGDHGGIWVQGSSPPAEGSKVVATGTFLKGDECQSPLVEYVICETSREVD